MPASTSNLGPGFDALGLALTLELAVTLRFEPEPGPPRVEVRDAPGWPAPDGSPAPEVDLLTVAFARALETFGVEPATDDRGGRASRAVFSVESAIPIARGLGSSAAAIVAGLELGAALAERPPPQAELLRLAIELEGHPDNVTPALLGGLCLTVVDAGRPHVVRFTPHSGLAYALAWPETRLSTSEARALLPRQVAFADAVENPRRLALLLEGLRTGDAELLRLGGEDRLHVPHRLPRIPGGAAALEAARAAGAHLATVSGSGTALFAIAPHAAVQAVAEALRAELEGPGGGASARVVAPAAGASVGPAP